MFLVAALRRSPPVSATRGTAAVRVHERSDRPHAPGIPSESHQVVAHEVTREPVTSMTVRLGYA